MTKLLKTIRNAALGLSLVLASGHSLAAEEVKEDNNIKEEMAGFSNENQKLRENHIQEMRTLHVNQINEMYDRKSAHNKEMGGLWSQVKPGDREGSKAIRKQIKEKQHAYRQEMVKFRKDLKDMLDVKRKDFMKMMKARISDMKTKHKE